MRLHKPFDVVTKELLEADPLAWLRLVGLPGAAATLEDTNLTTLTVDADRVMRVAHTAPYIANIEFQASREHSSGTRQGASIDLTNAVCSHSGLQQVHSSVHISIQREAAFRTEVPPLLKSFLCPVTTS